MYKLIISGILVSVTIVIVFIVYTITAPPPQNEIVTQAPQLITYNILLVFAAVFTTMIITLPFVVRKMTEKNDDKNDKKKLDK